MVRRTGLTGVVLLAVLATGCGGTTTTESSAANPATATTAPSSGIGPATVGEIASADTVVPSSADGPATSTTASATDTAASVTLAQKSTSLADGLRVSAVIGGGAAVDMTVDTGSNGILVSRSYVGAAATPLTPARMFSGWGYSSSGNTYSGEWMTAALELGSPGGSDHPASTTPMLIRVVDEDDVAMMGVGFGRPATGPDADLDGPGLNPFLHLTTMGAGAMPQAYVIGLDRIVLGPTASDRAGFQTVALTENAAGTDWDGAPACVAVPSGGVVAQCGTVLLDTGLPYAIIEVPTGVEPPTTPAATSGDRPSVDAGQQVQVTMPGLSTPLYEFTVGGSGAPTSVQWGHDVAESDGRPFMNISRYALTQHDYLYDASVGQVGFRPVG